MASHVQIISGEHGYRLLRNGEAFFVKGAVAWEQLELLAECGANAVRMGVRSAAQFERLNELGLSVLVNLPVRSQRDGMDYDDSAAVSAQHERVLAQVREYRGFPAVLAWALGNELDWVPDVPGHPYEERDFAYNRTVWDAVNALARDIHRLDPAHPVLTVVGSVNRAKIASVLAQCPQLDLLGVNEYGDLLDLPRRLRDYGWTKPYLVTEWGPTGFWQVPRCDWGAPIEESSAEKADRYRERYEGAIMADRRQCLGAFVFLWRQHQERTHTWFGMFDSQWRASEAVDVMRYEWSGSWPAHRCARIGDVRINTRSAVESIRLMPAERCRAEATVQRGDTVALSWHWEILPEGTHFPYGGRGEQKPSAVEGLIEDSSGASIVFCVPSQPGPYRLFVYAYDTAQHFATANVPFFVREK